MASVFRRSALERISSPEQLDRLFRPARAKFSSAAAAAAVMLLCAFLWFRFGALPVCAQTDGLFIVPEAAAGVHAPADGTIAQIYVGEGAPVAEGMPLAELLCTDGTTAELCAPCSGRIALLCAERGGEIAQGDLILRLTPSSPLCAVGMFPAEEAAQMKVGMPARVFFGNEFCSGTVLCADACPAQDSVLPALGSEGAPVAVVLEDEKAPEEGAAVRIQVILGERSPAELLCRRWEGQ